MQVYSTHVSSMYCTFLARLFPLHKKVKGQYLSLKDLKVRWVQKCTDFLLDRVRVLEQKSDNFGGGGYSCKSLAFDPAVLQLHAQ